MSILPTRYFRDLRVGILFGAVACIAAVFVVQLFIVQVVQHDYYVTQADSEQIKKFKLRAERGEIYAMDGSDPKPLVMNETVYKVWADPTQITNKQAIIDTLNSVAGGNVVNNFSSLIDKKPSRYQVLTKYITRTQAELIKKKKLSGIGFEIGTRRVYPEGRLASQVLGFVNHEGKGVYGFEQANNQALSGRDGMLKTVTDARDVPLTIGDKNVRQPAVNATFKDKNRFKTAGTQDFCRRVGGETICVIDNQRTVFRAPDFIELRGKVGKREVLGAGDVCLMKIGGRANVDEGAVIVGKNGRARIADFLPGRAAITHFKEDDARDTGEEEEEEEEVVCEELSEGHDGVRRVGKGRNYSRLPALSLVREVSIVEWMKKHHQGTPSQIVRRRLP